MKNKVILINLIKMNNNTNKKDNNLDKDINIWLNEHIFDKFFYGSPKKCFKRDHPGVSERSVPYEEVSCENNFNNIKEFKIHLKECFEQNKNKHYNWKEKVNWSTDTLIGRYNQNILFINENTVEHNLHYVDHSIAHFRFLHYRFEY